MGHSTEGIAIPADKPHRAMTRVGFRELRDLVGWQQQTGQLRGETGKGYWHSRKAKVRCHLCMRKRLYKGLLGTMLSQSKEILMC